MKLLKYELEEIVNKVHDNLVKERNLKVESLEKQIKTDSFKKQASEIEIFISNFKIKFPSMNGIFEYPFNQRKTSVNKIEEFLRESLSDKASDSLPEIKSRSEIRSEVVLKAIDCAGFSELRKFFNI